jgi:hypothetical protein
MFFLLIIGYNDNNYCCNTHIVFIHYTLKTKPLSAFEPYTVEYNCYINSIKFIKTNAQSATYNNVNIGSQCLKIKALAAAFNFYI